MSIQLSLYWQAVDQLEWYWAGDSDVYSGALEELKDQKKERNLDNCIVRLFLPAQWFSTIDVQLPAKGRRINPQMLRFAAEEYLAQDIDSVHLVLKGKPVQGRVAVEVTDLARFSQIIATLRLSKFIVTEAYNSQRFWVPQQDQADDLQLLIRGDVVTVSSRDQIFTVHTRGFAQWFELWAQQNELPDDARLQVVSDSAEGPAKAIVTEFEATGYALDWRVENPRSLVDWHDLIEQSRPSGNLMTGAFSQHSDSPRYERWLPTLVAGVAVLILWSTVTVLENHRLSVKINETWQASESVFLQVFGQNKRIQRPLMVREMRSRVASAADGETETGVNALTFLQDISAASASFLLEDFRFNKERNEAFFTLTQSVQASGDAYSLFEALKNDLAAKGYQVEYSANQESEFYRAQFKAVYGGQG